MDNELKITIALIAAGAAVFGSVVSQVFLLIQGFLEKKHKKNILLREKYECLANHVTESMLWLSHIQGIQTLEQLTAHSVPTDARKSLSLASLYFPLLREDCISYLNSLVNFHVVLISSYRHIPGVSAGAQAVAHNKDEFLSALSRVQKSRQILDESIIEYARKYAKA